MEDKSRSDREKLKDILLGRVGPMYRQKYREEQIKTNLSRMLGLSVYMTVIQLIQCVFYLFKPFNPYDRNANLITSLTIVSLGVGLIFFSISILCKKEKIKNPKILGLLPLVLVYLYGIFQIIFFGLYAQVGIESMNSFVSAVLVISFCLIVKPIINIVNVGICIGAVILIVFSVRDQNSMWHTLLIANTWANLMVITVLVLFMSSLTYYMFVSNLINRIKLEKSVERATALARVDTLTDAMNRRGLFERLGNWWPELVGDKCQVSVVMFDIDYFKAFNDQFGHLEGDNCLFKVAHALQEYFGGHSDCFCRFGGEEFLAIFCVMPGENSWDIIEDSRRAVESLAIKSAPESQFESVTVSVGFVTESADGFDYEKLINQADIALYHSKRTGRNRVSQYQDGQIKQASNIRNGQIKQASNIRNGEDLTGTVAYIGAEKRTES